MKSVMVLPEKQRAPLVAEVHHVLRLHKKGLTEEDWQDVVTRTLALAKRVGTGKQMIYDYRQKGNAIEDLLTYYTALIDTLAFFYFYLEHFGFSYFAANWQEIMNLSS